MEMRGRYLHVDCTSHVTVFRIGTPPQSTSAWLLELGLCL